MSISSFLRTMSVKRGYLVLGLVLTTVLSVSVLTGTRQSQGDKGVKNGITFSHAFHVTDAGLACVDCHGGAPASRSVADNLNATHSNCESCHEEQIDNNCTYCHTSADPLTYLGSSYKTRNLLFSHELHVEGQLTACETCHAGVAAATDLASVHAPSMATCTSCHNDTKASNACEVCHTDLSSLRPVEHNRNDFVREHKRLARMDDATCATCHTQETCVECHNGADLVQVELGGMGPVSPRATRLTGIDRGQATALTKVHDLNFRFTHGIVAQGKSSECQTCHQEQSFCAACHTGGNTVTQGRFKPANHAEPGFVTFGVGSGGGGHARFARRDIENCASCHDAEGADPTCLTCHVDTDGVKGTDPRTHQRGYMQFENGYWHSDPGASCYTCHADANARVGGIRGQKFCGYCHS